MAHKIYNLLKSNIISGKLKPNERILELELAEKFNSSQSPVREALRRLQEQGLVNSEKYTGTFVAPISPDEMQELFELRSVLEKHAVKNAMYLMKREDKDQLKEIVSNMMKAAQKDNLLEVIECDMKFHQFLIDLSGKRTLTQIWSFIDAHVRRFLVISHPAVFKDLYEVVSKHQILLEKINSNDIKEVELAFEQHSLLSWDDLMKIKSGYK